MPIELTKKKPLNPFYLFARLSLYRVVSIFLIIFALQYWASALGLNDDKMRFDLMQEHWQVVITILCVLLPVSALGLWAGASWGVVIFLLAAITELIMYQGFPQLFGEGLFRVVFYLICLLFFTVLISLGFLLENKR